MRRNLFQDMAQSLSDGGTKPFVGETPVAVDFAVVIGAGLGDVVGVGNDDLLGTGE